MVGILVGGAVVAVGVGAIKAAVGDRIAVAELVAVGGEVANCGADVGTGSLVFVAVGGSGVVGEVGGKVGLPTAVVGGEVCVGTTVAVGD